MIGAGFLQKAKCYKDAHKGLLKDPIVMIGQFHRT